MVEVGSLVVEVGGFEAAECDCGMVVIRGHFIGRRLLRLRLVPVVGLVVAGWPRLSLLEGDIYFLFEYCVSEPSFRARFLEQKGFVELGCKLGFVSRLADECAMWLLRVGSVSAGWRLLVHLMLRQVIAPYVQHRWHSQVY